MVLAKGTGLTLLLLGSIFSRTVACLVPWPPERDVVAQDAGYTLEEPLRNPTSACTGVSKCTHTDPDRQADRQIDESI